MFDAIQLFFKNLWNNIIAPCLIFLAIAGVFFGVGLAVGSCSIGRTDNQLETFREESIAERQRIESLNSQIRIVTESNSNLRETIRCLNQGYSDIGKIIRGLSNQETNNLAQLRGIITALEEIQRIIGDFRDN